MSGVGRDAVLKVKIIDTEYVYADPMSFKSVVQRLTGKDAEANKTESSSARRSTERRSTPGMAVVSMEFLSQEDTEFDRMLKEMTSMEERKPRNSSPSDFLLSLGESSETVRKGIAPASYPNSRS